jgi:hypothetical protein
MARLPNAKPEDYPGTWTLAGCSREQLDVATPHYQPRCSPAAAAKGPERLLRTVTVITDEQAVDRLIYAYHRVGP